MFSVKNIKNIRIFILKMLEKSIFFITLTKSAKFIGAGLATCGLGGAGIGIGIIFAGLMNAFARNSEREDELMRFAILGFALTEAMGLISLLIALLLLFT